MEREIFVAFAFGVEPGKALSWHDVALERAYLAFVQHLLAVLVLATGVGSRTRSPYEFFSIEICQEIRGLALETVAFGFAGTSHLPLCSVLSVGQFVLGAFGLAFQAVKL